MRIKGKTTLFAKHIIVMFLIISFSMNSVFAAPKSACAEVKLIIPQKLSFERQSFDARLVINNGLSNASIENVRIDLTFTDNNDNAVVATTDPNTNEAQFFYRIDSMTGIKNIEGNGSVSPNTSGQINWLIIPTIGAANKTTSGAIYHVGATVTYTLNGVETKVDVTPDYIIVKPLPELILDYFLPKEVYSDDPFTPETEESIPFTLGVSIKNNGLGEAKNTKIDSADVRIKENKAGLLIDFNIWSSYVNDEAVNKSLLLNFGNIAPQETKVGRWIMTTSLSGFFTEFEAHFTHADDLGGTLTSLIKEINTHTLVKDVKVELAGRDNIRDFLAYDGDVLRLYESEGINTIVSDISASAQLNTVAGVSQLSLAATEGFFFAKIRDPWQGKGHNIKVARYDGSLLLTENAWLSKERNEDLSWSYYINIFDANAEGIYTLIYEQDAIKTISITGKLLVKQDDNRGVGGMTIQLYDPLTYIPKQTTSTDLEGNFSFHKLKDADYAVKAITSNTTINSIAMRSGEPAANIYADVIEPGLVKYVKANINDTHAIDTLVITDSHRYELHQANGSVSPITNLSDMANLSPAFDESKIYIRFPETKGYFYIKKAISWAEWFHLNPVWLPDEHQCLPKENVWITKSDNNGITTYYLNIFGYDNVNHYSLDYPKDAVVGQLFNDINHNGIQDSNEHNITNVEVSYNGYSLDNIYHNQQVEYADNNGVVHFPKVNAGRYQLQVNTDKLKLNATTTSVKHKVYVTTEDNQ